MTFETDRALHFPYMTENGIRIEAVDRTSVYAVTGRLADDVFQPLQSLGLSPFQPMPPRLAAESKQHTEQFVFYDAAGEPVGWSMGEQREGDAFFMGWSGILPSHQRLGIYSAFLGQLLGYVKRLGYRRVTSNHMVNNRAVIIAKLKAGFIITGYSLDERFGAVVWLTYYLEAEREQAFERAFSLERRRASD